MNSFSIVILMFGWFTGKAPIDPPKVKDDACVKDTNELNPKGIKPYVEYWGLF